MFVRNKRYESNRLDHVTRNKHECKVHLRLLDGKTDSKIRDCGRSVARHLLETPLQRTLSVMRQFKDATKFTLRSALCVCKKPATVEPELR